MRFLKVLGLLALIAAACTAFVALVAGPIGHDLRGHPYALPAMIGREIGGWITIFAVAAIGAGIAAFATRKRGNPYPGLATGTALALIVTVMSWLGRQPT